MPEDIKQLERRCPRLGNAINFEYCLHEGGANKPCWKAIDCWWEYFDVVAELEDRLPPETVAKLKESQPKPKVASLIEQIAAAKSRLEE